jgi:tRNA (cytidine/uridine-2'-O-)-methyltransferase
MPLHVVLFEPEIPPNTGNVIRLCANTGARLHLVRPLGFNLDARAVRRAGLDYHELADVQVHADFEQCLHALTQARPDGTPARWFALTTKGETRYDAVSFAAGDVVVFGPESRGLPADLLARHFTPDRRLRIPMQPGARSLNLANAAAVVVYEAWRQLGWR